MSKHSIRRGASGSPSASCSSSSATALAVRSPDRRTLCWASACDAFCVTVCISTRLSPRCGRRTATWDPRRSESQCPTSAGSLGATPVRTSRGIASGNSSPYRYVRKCSINDGPSTSATFSVTVPRWPLTRPPRTWNTWNAASSSSSTMAITSASVSSGRTMVLRSSARSRARMSSRRRAARSYCWSFDAAEHVLLPVLDEPAGVSGQEGTEVVDESAMVVRRDAVDTRSRALVDVSQQAGAPHLTGPLEHTGAAGPDRKYPEQLVERLADRPGVRVRAEVPASPCVWSHA